MKTLRRSVLFLLLLGCSTTMSQVPAGPIAWREGYRDGCDSGLSGAGHPYVAYVKNFGRIESDAQYKQGWADGYDACKTRYSNSW